MTNVCKIGNFYSRLRSIWPKELDIGCCTISPSYRHWNHSLSIGSGSICGYLRICGREWLQPNHKTNKRRHVYMFFFLSVQYVQYSQIQTHLHKIHSYLISVFFLTLLLFLRFSSRSWAIFALFAFRCRWCAWLWFFRACIFSGCFSLTTGNHFLFRAGIAWRIIAGLTIFPVLFFGRCRLSSTSTAGWWTRLWTVIVCRWTSFWSAGTAFWRSSHIFIVTTGRLIFNKLFCGRCSYSPHFLGWYLLIYQIGE